MWPRDDIMSEAEVRKANTVRRRQLLGTEVPSM